MRQPSPPIRGAQDGEEARAVAGELQSKGGQKQETHTQPQVDELPWLRETLLGRFIQSPSWENSSELLPSTCWPFGHTPTAQMTIIGDHSPEGAEDAYRAWAKDAERPKLSNQKLKRSGHCALSIKEKPLAWDPECQGVERQRGRDIIFRIFIPWAVRIFPQLFATVTALYMTSRRPYTTMAANSVPNPLLPLRSRGSINCGVK